MKRLWPRRLNFILLLWLAATHGLAYRSAHADLVELSNQSLHFAFDPSYGSIIEFRDLKTGRNFTGGASTNSAIWEINLPLRDGSISLTPARARTFKVTPWKEAPGSTRAASRPAGSALQFTWQDFDITAVPALRVEVTVTLEKRRPMTFWSIALDGLAGSLPSAVRFPRLVNIPRQTNEMLAVPLWLGQETADPRNLLLSPGRAQRLEWPYPGQLSLQCLALYSQGGPGLYLSCDDAAIFRKAFAFFGDGEGHVGCEFVHVPRAGGISADRWTLPYHAVLGTFSGNWITAAERYREWATNQAWCTESRLRQNQVPEWVLKTGMWEWNRGRSPGVLPPAIALQTKLGLPVSVFWHWWHGCAYDTDFPEYLPPREGVEPFETALASAHTNGVHALVYMNQRLWGTATKSWTEEGAERFAVKDRHGKTYTEVYNTFTRAPCASMCLGTDFWRNKFAGLAERAVRELGVDGIYMDQACANLVCYDAAHGHAVGPGMYWMEGFRTLTKDIRKQCGNFSRSPVVLAGEGCGEAWLPWLDLMLCLQVSKERYSAPESWNPIPFFQAVYHPYAVTYGNYSSLTMPPYDDLWPAQFAPREPLKLLDRKYSRQFLLEQARAFAWGQQPTIANFLPDQLVERAEETDYMMRLARIRSQASKYLLHGTFLPPPEIHAQQATLDLSRLSIYAGQQGGLTSCQKTSPLALASAWRAPDGDVALVIASMGDEPMNFSFTLARGDYHLPSQGKMYRLDENGRKSLGSIPRNDAPVCVSLPRQGACLLEFVSDH